MPKINLSKRAPIVPVRPAMRAAQRHGVNPYDTHASVMHRYANYARMCGAVPAVPSILKPQAA